MLNCLGNVYDPKLGGQKILDELINLYSYQKAFIRKKAYAVTRVIFEQSSDLIGENIEKVIAKLKDERDDRVISVMLGCFFTVLK